MKRVLYDTNVILDVVAARAPFLQAPAAALDLVARGRIEGFVAGHAVTTIAYLVQREHGRRKARQALLHLLSVDMRAGRCPIMTSLSKSRIRRLKRRRIGP